MRKLIAGMKLSLDGKVTGPDGVADWVDAWSEDFGVTPHVDACLLGGGMYPTYEQYWTQIQDEPTERHPFSGELPTEGELEWARFVARTPHYVLSSTVASAQWPQTSFVTTLDDVDSLKRQQGKDIYLVGGARTTGSLIDAGLVDELRLLVYPLIAGEGTALFTTPARRRLELRKAEQLADGRVSLSYAIG